MEGDAKGQVGGMEMSEKERRRLADESRVWRCHGCGGRTNEDILKEEGGEANEGSQTRTMIPEELKFGFKDQMAKHEDKGKGKGIVLGDGSNASTDHDMASTQGPSESLPMNPTTTTVAQTSGSPESLTAQLPQAQPSPAPQPAAPPTNGSSPWLDKAITGVAAALAVMVIKKVVLS